MRDGPTSANGLPLEIQRDALAISLRHYTLETLVVYIIHSSETFVWYCPVRTFVRDATITLPFFSLDKRLEHDLPTAWPWSFITTTNQSTTTLSLSRLSVVFLSTPVD
jgi:hypothetical protein